MADTGSTTATIVIMSRENFPLANNVGDKNDWMVLARQWFNRAFSGDSLGSFGQAYSDASDPIGTTDNGSGVIIWDGATRASQTATFSTHATAGDTVTIGGIVFTCEASGATGNQWNEGADEEESASNLAVAINAYSGTTKSVYGETDGNGVLTVYAYTPGQAGNLITISKSSTAITLAGTALAGGTSNATVTYSF